ncbi:MAG: hypothetical protein B6D65_01490 [candidate division Zixibacteria bacterium 4484_93]|nr:MAG: hypothetical protein B6D65_01490 [candidate division Zixibacteria bacterium 4484_93]
MGRGHLQPRLNTNRGRSVFYKGNDVFDVATVGFDKFLEALESADGFALPFNLLDALRENARNN